MFISNVKVQLVTLENSGTADQLKVYGTYQQAWHDKEVGGWYLSFVLISISLQALKSKLYDELEEMVARYLRPVNLQLEDIYKRLSSLEKRINQ